ncbi:MAG: ThuA domain-containing protein [Phycisphaerae bacterium]|nr:ThuA domain-containing protein [Phycisphaerae bacterium]
MKRLIDFVWLLVLMAAMTGYAVTEQEKQAIQSAMPDQPVVKPAAERTMLVFSLCNGFKHSSIPYWIEALNVMSQKTGAFKVVHSTEMSVFNPETLRQYDAICFNNTTKLTPDAAQQKAILDFVKSGKGIVGIHAATDNFYDWPEGMEMMGGVFSGHPWTGDGTWAVKIDDPQHPLMQPFKGQGFKIKDEIYRTAAPLYSRTKQRVLMSLDMSDPATKNARGVTPEDADTGISWIKQIGQGRLFYCSLGHDHAVTWNPAVLQHYLAGIQYALGDLKVDDRPLAKTLEAEKVDAFIEQLRQYDWDKPKAPLYAFSELIREYGDAANLKGLLEAKLLQVLEADVPLAAKDYICRQLAVIGSGEAVPVLGKMLDASETSDMARYALERIPSDLADKLLLSRLQMASSPTAQIGIINSLGVRRTDAAAAVLAEYAGSANPAVALAAIQALSAVGSRSAAETLQKLTVDEALQERLADALLACADSLCRQGHLSDAQAIYKKLYASGRSAAARIGALNGLAKTNAAEMRTILPEAIKGQDLVLQAAAIQILAGIEDASLLEEAAAQMDTLPDNAKIQLCAALSANPKKIGRDKIERLVGSPEKEVRIAAYQALAVLGNASSVEPLAKAAAAAADRQEAQQARAALYLLSAPEVNKVIIDRIESLVSAGDEKTVVELIRAAGQRGLSEAVPALLRTARGEGDAASESVRVLQGLAGLKDMGEFADLVTEKPLSRNADALAAAARRLDDAAGCTAVVLARYDSAASEEAKVTLLRVLGKLGDAKAAALLRKEKDAPSQTLRQGALRAMMDWPGGDFIDEMKTLAEQEQDQRTRVMAFTAYVRMITETSDKNSDAGVGALIEAFSMAPQPDQQRLVIGALGSFVSQKALDFTARFLDNSALKAEAQASVVRICEAGGISKLPQAKDLLAKVAAAAENRNLKERAEKLLR